MRVSTNRQGEFGLGIDAQRATVQRHLQACGGHLNAEFVEVESGKFADRPVLTQALAHCRKHRSILLIAKLDRLGRNVAFVSSLMDAGTEFLACDAPYANRLMLHILAAFAEHERVVISERTKAALKAAKARGVKLGANGAVLAQQQRSDAVAFAVSVQREIASARLAGQSTLSEIAAHLNCRGVPARGGGHWHPTSVRRVLVRLEAPSDVSVVG